jgi:hypothetical protein
LIFLSAFWKPPAGGFFLEKISTSHLSADADTVEKDEPHAGREISLPPPGRWLMEL